MKLNDSLYITKVPYHVSLSPLYKPHKRGRENFIWKKNAIVNPSKDADASSCTSNFVHFHKFNILNNLLEQ